MLFWIKYLLTTNISCVEYNINTIRTLKMPSRTVKVLAVELKKWMQNAFKFLGCESKCKFFTDKIVVK